MYIIYYIYSLTTFAHTEITWYEITWFSEQYNLSI